MQLTARQLRLLELALILATACHKNINENVIEDDEEQVTPEEFIALHEFIGLTPQGETTA
jgi:hypothetical protein